MLIRHMFIAALLSMMFISGCDSGSGTNDLSETSEIVTRNRVDIRSVGDAQEHSVVIQATYNPAFSEIELLVCIPRPRSAPVEAKGQFIFSLEDEETKLVSTTVGSKVKEERFEAFFVFLQPDFLKKVRLYFEYLDTPEFKATGELMKSYGISFDEMASEIIEKEVDLGAPRDPLRPRRLPSCIDAIHR